MAPSQTLHLRPPSLLLLTTTLLLLTLPQQTHSLPTPSNTPLATASPLPDTAVSVQSHSQSTTTSTSAQPTANNDPGSKPLASGVILAIFLAGIVIIGSIIGSFVVVRMNRQKRIYEAAEEMGRVRYAPERSWGQGAGGVGGAVGGGYRKGEFD
ncbi:hypothetical protein DM02DRAFT_141691 [Periconia macrospinosa]|uniref:Mid2 domain-containing protein n=1 Tax=Periconia macrospinosa TaxID=97972 RepID=A0A2V1DC43_9PLEO|nr:hypothetical protein DM02DRAFT_141691 [Periconia macrospinosa]